MKLLPPSPHRTASRRRWWVLLLGASCTLATSRASICRKKPPMSIYRGPTLEGLHPDGACWCCWSPHLMQTIPDGLFVILRFLCCSRPLHFMWTCSHLFNFILAHYLHHLIESRWVWEHGMRYYYSMSRGNLFFQICILRKCLEMNRNKISFFFWHEAVLYWQLFF